MGLGKFVGDNIVEMTLQIAMINCYLKELILINPAASCGLYPVMVSMLFKGRTKTVSPNITSAKKRMCSASFLLGIHYRINVKLFDGHTAFQFVNEIFRCDHLDQS